MRADAVRSRRRLGIVLMVVAGHGAFFWQLARGLEHRPPVEGPVWMSQVSLPETPSPQAAAAKADAQAQPQAQKPLQPQPPAKIPETPLLLAAAPLVAQASAPASATERKTADRFEIAAPTQVLYEVSGKVKGFPYFARGSLLWQHDGRQYQARYEVGLPLLGSRVQTSQGDLTALGLAPKRFGDKTKTELAAHFERDKGLISFSANTPTSPLLPGAQDRLSLFMQLAAQLAADPKRYPAGAQIDLQTVSAREAEMWSFKVEGAEQVSLPLGDVEALRLRRLPRREFDQLIDLWFAPTLSYLPVRIRLQQANGDVADQRAKSVAPP
jgi:hypothetical protein